MLPFLKDNEILNFYINQVNDQLENALHVAAYKGKVGHVKALLDYGINANAVSLRNETSLYIACALGHVEIARLIFNHLISNGSPIFHTMIDDYTIFEAAKNSGNPKMLEELIKLYNQFDLLPQLPDEIFLEYFLVPPVIDAAPLPILEPAEPIMAVEPDLGQIHVDFDVNAFFADQERVTDAATEPPVALLSSLGISNDFNTASVATSASLEEMTEPESATAMDLNPHQAGKSIHFLSPQINEDDSVKKPREYSPLRPAYQSPRFPMDNSPKPIPPSPTMIPQ